jgi:hypothetical protein
MRTLIGALLALVPSVVAGQTTTWSGSLQAASRPAEAVEARIDAGRSATASFPLGVAGREARATGVRYDGTTVSFEAALGGPAQCRLDAAPARGYSGLCRWQSGDSATLTLIPPVPGMLFPDHEVALALDAGPPTIGGGASVLVFGPAGYTEVVSGTNGFTCFIWRPRPQDLWPICETREAADAIVPLERLRLALRAAGVDEARIADSVTSAYRSGRLRPPPPGAVGYMLSNSAWTVDRTGARAFVGPHLHFYTPYDTNARLGIDSTGKGSVPMRLEREGAPDASVIVPVRLRKPG